MIPYILISVLLVVAVVAFYLSRLFVSVPFYHREGFYGGASDSLRTLPEVRTLPEASQLLEMLRQGQASSDYAELELLLGKMAALKKDLLSPRGVVDATRSLAFDTAHDRVAVAELCGMCMTHTIAPRDLDIDFATWRDRGNLLIRQLSTASLSDAQTDQALKLFSVSWEDVYQIAQQKCLKTIAEQRHGSGKGSDVGSYEPPATKQLRNYANTYGGLSASGWNGAV